MKKEQIEKAANEFAEREYEISDIDKDALYKGFYWGANWYVNSVWHDASEQPKRNKVYLVQMGKDAFDTFYDSENWKVFKRDINITRWAYIEDLLPNKEE